MARSVGRAGRRSHLIDFHLGGKVGSYELKRQYYVYMMTNRWNTVIYAGVTGDLRRRVYISTERD